MAVTLQGSPAFGRGATRVVQRATVEHYSGGTVRAAILSELESILAAAEARDGAPNSGPALQHLEKLKNSEGVPDPGNRSTYGLSGASFFEGVNTVYTQGPTKFHDAIAKASGGSGPTSLGARKTGRHDEMHHITDFPGVQAVLSTQAHCLFCYGVLAKRGYQHGQIRDNAYPTLWEHDYLKFKLRETSKDLTDISNLPAIRITTIWGTHYYRVEDHGS